MLAQRGMVGKLHHRQVAGDLQRELEALLAFGLRSGARGGLDVGQHASQFVFAGEVGKAVGGVQRVLAEFLRQVRQTLLDLGIARLGLARQLGAAQREVAQAVFQRLLLLGIERGRVDGLVLGVKALVRAQPGEELGHARQGGVVGGAQLRRVHDGLQVRDGAPGAPQALGGDVERARQGAPFGRLIGLHDAFEGGLGLLEQFVHRRGDVLGADLVESRQVGEVEQGIGGGRVHSI